MSFLTNPHYDHVRRQVAQSPKVWLVTGAAGFIGSHLVEQLLSNGQTVVGMDNFLTGHQSNIDDVLSRCLQSASRFRFIEGDIRDLGTCHEACVGVDNVLHQAALGSVPRSIRDPITSSQVNVDGFLNMLVAARDAGVKRFIYASSSSVYGDAAELPQLEHRVGRPLSPYAVTKVTDEHF